MTPYGVYLFARTYGLNADALGAVSLPGMSDHPRRLLYFQALEHFFRCHLLLNGKTPEEVRNYNHDFEKMLDDSKFFGLVIPKAVEAFIRLRSVARDYTRIRYDFRLDDPNDPTQRPPPMTQMQRAVRTLEKAVGRAIEASNPDCIVLDGNKFTMIAGSANFKAWS
ncbi:hypothetical protein CK219_27275 [Mesorhizobium sp. WSM4313]|nr:hypothetical protein CK219_27275 [Mesorhizobium sp. WSM4313]